MVFGHTFYSWSTFIVMEAGFLLHVLSSACISWYIFSTLFTIFRPIKSTLYSVFYPGMKQITKKPKSSSSNLFHLCLHFVLVLATEYSLSAPAVIQCHSLDNWPIFQLKMRDVRCCHCKHWTWVKRGSKVGQPRSVQWSKELPRSRKGCHVYWAGDD